MIPDNRPVIGRDLDTIKQQFGLSTADACHLFGMSITKWTHVARQGADVPVTDPTLALLARFLDGHPELNVIPRYPDPTEMYDFVNDIHPVDQKAFSVLMGSEASATYRWRKTGSRPSPVLQRLMHYMRLSLLARDETGKVELLSDWRTTVAQEGLVRGVPNVFKVGRWRSSAPAPASPPRKAAAARLSKAGTRKKR